MSHPTKFIFMRGTQPASPSIAPQVFSPAPPPYASHHATAQMNGFGMHTADEEADFSPIAISIAAPVSVIGDSNRLSLDPAEIASQVAHSIASTLKKTSMASAGIPMIDENGRPRPIEVRVDATIKIEGNQNIIGNRTFQAQVTDMMNHQKRKNEIGQQSDNMDIVEDGGVQNGRKRTRNA